MALNTVTLTWNLSDFLNTAIPDSCTLYMAPTTSLADTADGKTIIAITRSKQFSAGTGSWTGIVANDNAALAPSGSGYNIWVTDNVTGSQILGPFTTQILFSNGATQDLSTLYSTQVVAQAFFQYVTLSALQSLVNTYTAPQLGTCQSVILFGADKTGVSDSTSAINAAITACIGTANPVTTTRVATGYVYLPAGTYKVTSDILIQSVQGVNFIGDGPESTIIKASGTSFTNAPIVVDGSYAGRFEGFTILGDGTEQVNAGLMLTYTTGSHRSTTSNKFCDIRIRNLNFINGFDMSGVTNRQLDGTRLTNIVIAGQQTAGSWSSSGNWQKGVVIGNGTFGNIYDQVLQAVDASGCYYGYYNNVSGFALYGAQPANNNIDFWISPGAQTTISNIQSQQCGTFLLAPSNFSPIPVTVSDVQVKTTLLNGTSNAIVTLNGGTWNFNNFSAAAEQVSGSYVNAGITIVGSTSSRPCVVNFNNLSLFGARTSNFSITNGVVSVTNYSNYNPTTGNYTAATGDAASLFVGGIWSSITGVTAPQVTYITATGNTTYNIPAGAQTLDVTVVGGGAGGTAGAFSTSGNAGGGMGGSGGGMSRAQFAVSALSTPVTVTVGAGGNGGAAVSSTGGGPSGVAGSTTAFGNYLWAKGGAASSVSVNVLAAQTGSAGGVGMYVSGQAGSVPATAGTVTGATAQATGGGGAGGSAAGTTVAAGSNGGTITGIASWGTPSAGTLAVAASTGFPTSGTVTVATSTTPALVSYTGVGAGTLTGCAYVSGGSGTVATGGAVALAANGAGCTAPALGVSSNSSAGGVVGGASPTNGNAPSAQGDTAPGGGGGAGAISGTAQSGANAQANSGAGGGGGGGCTGGTSSGAGGNGGSGFALIIAYFQ